MTDKRVQPRLDPPHRRGKRTVQVALDAEDYRKFYELVMEAGTSGNEVMRQLIRRAYDTRNT